MGNSIIIKKYDKKYAASIADMWNKSGENWGGSDSIKTEKEVIEEVENSTDLELIVALDENTVVGTCSFAKYAHDENTTYIPLLNVRPDYHGKKVGKLLVLEAVKAAIESGLPRLDLFTWPGNTKAVPLYKKCGFFWEKIDHSTHLMNFIPYVLETEAVKDKFDNQFDWYADSTRKIEVVPDGDEVGEFQFYQYSWEKNNKNLVIEFERKGRGIRLIETDDYKVQLELDKQKLVFGKEYEAVFTVENKSGKQLEIGIEGKNDKVIEFDMNSVIQVKDKEVVKGLFKINKIDEKQSEWLTHPSVCATVRINGKEAEFKLGVEPIFPINLEITDDRKPNYIGAESYFFLEMENSFEEKVTVSMEIPKSELLEFMVDKLEVEFDAKEKKSVKIPYKFKKAGFYSKDFNLKIYNEKFTVDYEKNVSYPLIGIGGMFYGSTEKHHCICSGKNLVAVDKINNTLFISTINGGEFNMKFPKLGKPFSKELSNKKADKVEYGVTDEYVSMCLIYKSGDFKGVELRWIAKMFQNGMLESYYEVVNHNEKITEISTCMDFRFGFEDAYIPYDRGVLKFIGDSESNMEYYKSEKISENWFFGKNSKYTRGICWDKDLEVKLKEYMQGFVYNFEDVKVGETLRMPSIFFAANVFGDVDEFRAYALKDNDLPKVKVIETTEVIVNDGNPFVEDDAKIKFIDNKFLKTNINMSISNEDKKIKDETFALPNGGEKEVVIKTDCNENIISIVNDTDTKVMSTERLVFKRAEGDVKQRKIQQDGYDVLELDNGDMKVKLAPNFWNGAYSLEYKGVEFLDTSFPNAGPKGWFNPWAGGFSFKPSNASFLCIDDEEKCAEFVEVKDQFGNTWSGIKSVIEFKKTEKFKGITLEQYYLTQNKQPVLMIFYKIKNNSGKYIAKTQYEALMFLKESEKGNLMLTAKDRENNICSHKCDGSNRDIEGRGSFGYRDKDAEYALNSLSLGTDYDCIYTNIDFAMDVDIFVVSMENNSEKVLGRNIIVFNKNELSTECMRTLEDIKIDL